MGLPAAGAPVADNVNLSDKEKTMNPNPHDIQPSDEVWYKGQQWIVLKVDQDIATLMRIGVDGRQDVQGELMHMSRYQSPNERLEPPEDDDDDDEYDTWDSRRDSLLRQP